LAIREPIAVALADPRVEVRDLFGDYVLYPPNSNFEWNLGHFLQGLRLKVAFPDRVVQTGMLARPWFCE
jgi:hypothetical protein